MERINISDLDASEISLKLNIKPFQGRQIFQWMHKKQVFSFEEMTNLPKGLRQKLTETGKASQLELVNLVVSPATGTKKALFRMSDGETVEAVLLRANERRTLCLSTQVGCAVSCSFCATGQSGFVRNLSPGEIVEQALHILAGEVMEARTPNIVYMGMGEPFHNYDATVKSIRLLMDKEGLGIGARKITVSTVGDLKGIRRFAKEDWQVRLSISLHAANDELRSKLVPMNKTHPLKRLMAAVRDYAGRTGRQVTFEWVLIRDVNDSESDAAQLIKLIHGIQGGVNVIPYNPIDETYYQAPRRRKGGEFVQLLEDAGISATLRKERGQDIDAACGQLRSRHIKPK